MTMWVIWPFIKILTQTDIVSIIGTKYWTTVNVLKRKSLFKMGKSAQVFKIEWIAQLNQQSLRLSQCNQFIHVIQTSIDQRRFWSVEVCVLFITRKPQRLPIKLSYSFQMGESRFFSLLWAFREWSCLRSCVWPQYIKVSFFRPFSRALLNFLMMDPALLLLRVGDGCRWCWWN